MPRVTIKLKGLENATKSQKRKIYSAIARSGFKDQLKAEIEKEVRLTGLEPDLKPRTIEHRKYLARFNKTHSKFRAAFSNLTLTGDLLNSMKAFYITAQNQFRFVFPKTRHKPYLKSNGKKIKGKQATMEQIYKWQSEAGRDIQEQIIIQQNFLDRISTLLIKSVQRYIKY